ncbi:hypothetical protein [Mycolicibacterium peregrinum]|uniref:Uncharacterized protein n=1 Tax=Mycolicibacterium peregrinum TaxID=43304 RepID=A0A4Z0HKV3_MYCPR|nr:hypothetical protein [Mycolicibacterium peregrinum]TGB37875.1 hypothetical protein EJD98_25330 [Mycolicibacterium peregrinum]TGB38106.1 hypothetical protein EJD94_25235 [Mycolicibacterium peregrinum]
MAKRYGRLSELNSGLVKLRDNVKDVEPDYEKVVDAFMTIAAVDGEAQMKEKAPWRDSKGNRDDRVPGEARAALSTVTDLAGNHKSIWFLHGVDYGIWLEISNNGKDQIIMPTVAAMGKKLMKSLRGTLNTIRKG